MTTQSEALRLADALMETHPYPLDIKQAAAELRRLSAENDLLGSAADKLRVAWRDEVHRLIKDKDQLQAQRDALLEALGKCSDQLTRLGYSANHADQAIAAIKAVEGEKK